MDDVLETRGGAELGGTSASIVRACKFANALEVSLESGAATE